MNKKLLTKSKTLLNQLKIVEKSNLKATVITSYFKGYHYLIEADLEDEKVFFEHKTLIEKGQVVYLSISL